MRSSNSKDNETCWYVIVLTESEFDLDSQLKEGKDPEVVLTLKHIEVQQGTYLATSNLEMRADFQDSTQSDNKKMTLEISFTRSGWETFPTKVHNGYLNSDASS